MKTAVIVVDTDTNTDKDTEIVPDTAQTVAQIQIRETNTVTEDGRFRNGIELAPCR